MDLSGAGDLVGAGIKYSKPFSNLVKDFKFATNAVKDFKGAPIKTQMGQGIYNFSRIPMRFGLNVTGAREVLNPIAYTLMKLNKGQSNGLGMFHKYELIPSEKLIPAYRKYMLSDTSWEKLLPSSLVPETSERAKQVFNEATSLKRYSDLPIYKLDFGIRDGFPHKGYRGTYKKNGTSFTSRPYDSSDWGIEPKINIGGHYVSSIKQPNGAFKTELKDTQHFSPIEYVNKW
ncbi:MAG: hypothetical protein ACI30B_03685 [Paludibacteraceae bacterium]